MFGMGAGELLVVLVVVLAVFGPGRLPEVMGSLGKGMQEFKTGLLPTEDGVLLLLFGVLRSGQITLRRIDGWQEMANVKPATARLRNAQRAQQRVNCTG